MLSGLPPPAKLSIISFVSDFRNYFCFNIFLPFLGKDKRMGTNPYPPRPSLIREGDTLIDPSGNIRRPAFTLAEVLITLGIIGVVAAMTMPTLIMQHQKKVFATKVKQTYSLVSNALLSSIAENETPKNWDYGQSVTNDGTADINNPEHVKKMIDKYFAPYFKVVESGIEGTRSPYLILSNGTVLTFMTDGNTENNIYTPDTLYITASFNGNKSIYNDESRDYARHDVMMVIPIKSNDTKVRFFTWQDNSSNFANVDRDKLKNQAKFGCNENIDKRLRWNCGALIQYDNWEIKDDYPWR